MAGEEGTYQDIVSAPDVWNQIMVELGLSLNVLSFKPAEVREGSYYWPVWRLRPLQLLSDVDAYEDEP